MKKFKKIVLCVASLYVAYMPIGDTHAAATVTRTVPSADTSPSATSVSTASAPEAIIPPVSQKPISPSSSSPVPVIENKALAQARALIQSEPTRSSEEVIKYLAEIRQSSAFSSIKDVGSKNYHKLCLISDPYDCALTYASFDIFQIDPPFAILHSIAVESDMQKTGVGKAFMAKMIDMARKHDVNRIELDIAPITYGRRTTTEEYNEAFLQLTKFYKKFGAVIDPDKVDMFGGELSMRAYIDVSRIPKEV